MAFSFGFYNSLNGDRTYDAIDISRIFDGVITDGVFAGIGDLFAVTPGSGLQVGVGSGKAWFNHTWNRNDSIYLLSVEEPDITLSRIDAVYIKVDGRESIRANTLEIRKGTPAVEPQKPLMTQNPDEGIYEHVLAYVTVRPAVTQIEAKDIEVVVGTEETPLVTSILQQTDIDSLWANWKSQFGDFLSENETEMDEWMSTTRAEFDEWWDAIKAVLDTETATRLQNQINELKTGKVDTTTYTEHTGKANAHSVGFGNLIHGNVMNKESANCNNYATELNPVVIIDGSSAPNSPGTGYWYLQTIVYNGATHAMQIAYPYNDISRPIRFRNCYSGSWTQWTDVITTSKIQEILRTPGISNRIGDIHTTMRTDMGSNWLKCSGIPISETTYPNARAIIDPYYSRWPIGATLWKSEGDAYAATLATDQKGIYATFVAAKSTTVTIKYGSAPNSMTNSKSVSIGASGTPVFIGYSKIFGWVLGVNVSRTSYPSFQFFKSDTISGNWALIGSADGGDSISDVFIKILDDGTLVSTSYSGDACYSSNGTSISNIPLSNQYDHYVTSVYYIQGKYYVTYYDGDARDNRIEIRSSLTSPVSAIQPPKNPSTARLFSMGSDVLIFFSQTSPDFLYKISGSSFVKVSTPGQVTSLKSLFPITKNGVSILCGEGDGGVIHFMRYSGGSVSYISSEQNSDPGSSFTNSYYVSEMLGDYAYLGDSIKKIEPYTPVIDMSPATAYVLAKELI